MPVSSAPAPASGWRSLLRTRVTRTALRRLTTPGAPKLFARYWVGLALLAGAGTAADTPRGLAHHRAAAERGFALAEFSLGLLHERGHGVPRDLERARHWFARAAEHGHPLAAERAHPTDPVNDLAGIRTCGILPAELY